MFFKAGLPYLPLKELPGKLIVIEGSDGSGRSTQILLLKQWLEAEGHAVLNTGLRRSSIVSQTIDKAKEGNTLGRTTLSLLYATDFADQLENRIIPALQAGFLVLADRYIFTPMARDMVRGLPEAWLAELYGFALIPDLVLWLEVEPEALVHRVLAKHGHLDYWESGMDLGLSDDLFSSFIIYQKTLKEKYAQLAQRHGFISIDGTGSIDEIQQRVRQHVLLLLK